MGSFVMYAASIIDFSQFAIERIICATFDNDNAEKEVHALVCPRRYCSGSSPEATSMASAAFFRSSPAAATAAGAMIWYL